MGLLDWQPPSTDSIFPDYSSAAFTSTPAATKTKPVLVSQPVHSAPSARSLMRTTSYVSPNHVRRHDLCSPTRSSLSRDTSAASSSSSCRSHHSTSASLDSTFRPQATRSVPTRKRRSTFDFYGADEELQSAESRIAYCALCRKHCNVHCNG